VIVHVSELSMSQVGVCMLLLVFTVQMLYS
jgi:hypothetical protein